MSESTRVQRREKKIEKPSDDLKREREREGGLIIPVGINLDKLV